MAGPLLTKTFPLTRTSIKLRREPDDKYFVAGKTAWVATGKPTKGAYVGFLQAALTAADWDDVVRVVSAKLVLVTPPDGKTAITGLVPTNKAMVTLTVLKQGFADNAFDTFEDEWSLQISPDSGGVSFEGMVDNDIGLENRLSILRFIEYWAPKKVKVRYSDTDHPGKGLTNHGFQMAFQGSSKVVVGSELHPDPTARPRIEITYEAVPAPGVFQQTGPAPVISQLEGEYFEGDYIPGRVGDVINTYEIQVYVDPTTGVDDAGSKAVWKFSGPASASEVETNHFRQPLAQPHLGLLKSGTPYAWRVRGRNQRGEQTVWTAFERNLQITTEKPVLVDLRPPAPGGSNHFDTLDNVVFTARYSDPNTPPNRLLRYRVQLASSRPNDGWAIAPPPLWDTQDQAAAQSERDSGLISLPYSGEGLGPGTYSWRMKATDELGGESDWAYPLADLIIDVGETPDPGESDLLTGYRTRRAKVRILVYDMASNRGPGKLVGTIEDASNVGASEFHNSPGEFFFTLSALHPQVSILEPWKRHYSLQEYRGQGWKEIAAGILVDFDATDDDVVFYGMDYLGVLDLDLDSRFNVKGVDAAAGLYPAAAGGAKYSNITIKAIVQDQLDRAINHTGSPVGFISRGTIAAMNEKISIFSSFKNRLSFIAGLIDSHRGANLGLRTRIRVRKTASGGYQFVVDDNPGKDRDNIRLSYGELVQGFRAIPFGDWGTRVFAIGHTLEGGEVKYKPNILGTINETDYGVIPKVNLWQDITDIADLERRAKLYARQVSKVGKRLALAIRVDSIGVKDGWDIADSVLVDINRGVVNTLAYGSGYWTIWGWSWQLYQDGHTDLTLSISPRLDEEGPDADLIESKPIHNVPEWNIGSGPPTALTASTLAFETWVDVDTGQVYRYNPETSEWTETEVLAVGPPGPPGPPGTGDLVAPPQPIIRLPVETASAPQDDGSLVIAISVAVGFDPADIADLDDLSTILIETTPRAVGDPAVPDWTLATTRVANSVDATGVEDTIVNQTGLIAAATYWIRAYARDKFGNLSVPSLVATVLTATDDTGPPAPTEIVVTPGVKVFGVRWDDIPVSDFSYVEVQWRVADPVGNWASAQVAGTLMVVSGVVNDTTYDVRLRSVDRSGNTLDPVDGTVTAATNPEAGWVSGGTVTPSAMPGSSLVWEEGDIESLFAGKINADWIFAGTLRVGNAPDIDPLEPTSDDVQIEVYDAEGRLIGRWGLDGIELVDPTNPGYKMVLDEEGLVIWAGYGGENPYKVVSLTPLGIDAASITFGSARGGHNLVQNSSFEMGTFGLAGGTLHTWDVAADWDATRLGADTNIVVETSTLRMGTV